MDQWIVCADGKEVGQISCKDLLSVAEDLLARQSRGFIKTGIGEVLLVYELHHGEGVEDSPLTLDIEGKCVLLDDQGAYALARALIAYKNQQTPNHWLIRKMSVKG